MPKPSLLSRIGPFFAGAIVFISLFVMVSTWPLKSESHEPVEVTSLYSMSDDELIQHIVTLTREFDNRVQNGNQATLDITNALRAKVAAARLESSAARIEHALLIRKSKANRGISE